ncbi:MAG: energy transducer TonB [Syntrophaceae bacterium]|nr:energy transducer TonB [Syntrophaceae bacterium]
MQFIRPEKEKHPISTAIFFSLLVHFTAGIFLLFCLSPNSVSPTELNGINLVWITFDKKNEKSGTEIKSNGLNQTPSFYKRNTEEPKNMETPVHDPNSIQISTVTTPNLSNNNISVKNNSDGSTTETKEKYYNINRYSKNESTGNNSSPNTAIAYPLYKENSPPVYPEIARVRGYEGIVLVSAEILPDGRVGEVKIQRSSGYAILDQSAIQAVKPWKFEPAKKSGNPFTAWVELPIKFILHNNSQS